MTTSNMTLEQKYNATAQRALIASVEYQTALTENVSAMTLALLKAVAVLEGKEAQRLRRCLPTSN